jgi:hypothetical protein
MVVKKDVVPDLYNRARDKTCAKLIFAALVRRRLRLTVARENGDDGRKNRGDGDRWSGVPSGRLP